MAIKTFTTGEVLTSSDTNTYLANSGLVYITQATLTGASINIQGCFSATFDSYLLQFTNTKSTSSAIFVYWQLLNGATPITTATYNVQRASLQAGAWALTNLAASTSGIACVIGTDTGQGAACNIFNPFLTTNTQSTTVGVYTANAGSSILELAPTNQTGTTSCDGIKLLAQSGTFSTGKVIVYGYRQS